MGTAPSGAVRLSYAAAGRAVVTIIGYPFCPVKLLAAHAMPLPFLLARSPHRNPTGPAGKPAAAWLMGLCVALGALAPGLTPAPAHAMALDLESGLTRRAAQARVTLERIKLPANEKLGLVGTTYLVDIDKGFSAGPAAYGAISGQRGGFFTVGAEVNWRRRVVGPLLLDLGYYIGGGGGGNAPQGGGLMLRPHADLSYDLGGHSIGLSWSQVRFPNGLINSRQLGLVWNLDTDFTYVRADRIGQRADGSGRSGFGFDRMQPVLGVYRPRGNSGRASGGALPSSIGFVGARFERPISRHWYAGIEAAGAASGGVAGYAEYLGTLGAETPLWGDHLTIGARMALGMGGGGDVSTGGGLLVKGSAYTIVRLGSELGLTLEGGVTTAPQGGFRALHASTSLVWVLDDPNDLSTPRTTRTEWVGGVERYNALRRDGRTAPLQAVSLRVNRFVSPSVYLSGQAHSAYAGAAGGYSVGLLGVGYQHEVAPGWRVGAEALVGAAGGGGVDTSGGFIAQPMVYVHRDLVPGIGVRLGAGEIKGLRGPLSGTVVEASIAFTHGILSHGGR